MGIEHEQHQQDICAFDVNCITDLERLLESQEIMLGKSSREVADTLSALSELYWLDSDNAARAESCLLRALDIKTEIYGITHQEIIYLLDKLGDRYKQQGRHAEASRLDRWRRQAYRQMVEDTGSTPALTADQCAKTAAPEASEQTKQTAQIPTIQTAGTPPLCHSQELPVQAAAPSASSAPASAQTSTEEKCSDGGKRVIGGLVPVLPQKTTVPMQRPTETQHQAITQPFERVILSPIITEKKRPSRLVVEATEEHFELTADSLFVGTAEVNDICIRNDSQAEKFQAVVKREGQDFFVVNRAANHPTLLNGYAVTKQTKIGAGDMIKAGNSFIRVE